MSNPTRRRFLGTSVAIAGAATLPFVGSRAAAASKSAQERLRVAVLGVHGRGKEHISCLLNRDDVEIAAIVDPDESVGQSVCEDIQKKTGKRPQFIADLRKCYDDASINLITIATPNHWHALASIWAMQAGKDVYVEKPVSHNVAEGRVMTAAARKYNRMCQYGAQSRTQNGTRAMMQFIHDGGIGEVSTARGLCYKRRTSIGDAGKYAVPKNVDYSVWLGPAPLIDYVPRKQFHYDWHWQWPYGNGDLGNQGIHQMDVARWGLGVDGLGDSVQSYGGRLGYEDSGTTPNTEVSVHTFGEKLLVFETRGLETDGYSPHKNIKPTKIGVVFTGDKGYVVQYSYGQCVAYDLDGKQIKETKGGDTRDHFDNWLGAVRSRDNSQLNGDIEDGHYSSALCHLGNISYRLGKAAETTQQIEQAMTADGSKETLERTIEHLKKNNVDLGKTPLTLGPHLTLKGETFEGQYALLANDLLTREYREPFVVPTAENV